MDVHYCRICSEITNLFFFLIGDLMEIGLRSAAFLPLISLKKGLKFASQFVTLLGQKVSSQVDIRQETFELVTSLCNSFSWKIEISDSDFFLK